MKDMYMKNGTDREQWYFYFKTFNVRF